MVNISIGTAKRLRRCGLNCADCEEKESCVLLCRTCLHRRDCKLQCITEKTVSLSETHESLRC
ncbi:MAG: hypothetical protein ACE5PO_02900 [Candidatus Bathyarchaeia archaeon]